MAYVNELIRKPVTVYQERADCKTGGPLQDWVLAVLFIPGKKELVMMGLPHHLLQKSVLLCFMAHGLLHPVIERGVPRSH